MARSASRTSGWRDRLARSNHPLLSIWVVAAAAFFGISAVWSLATPIDATNDEGAQVLRAVSVVRGEILGTPLTPAISQTFRGPTGYLAFCENFEHLAGASRSAALDQCVKPYTIVTVPRRFVGWPNEEFCNGLDAVPDSCPVHLKGSAQLVRAVTYDGRYPPLYYAIVGLPSLLSQTNAGLYGMRLLSGMLTAVSSAYRLPLRQCGRRKGCSCWQ